MNVAPHLLQGLNKMKFLLLLLLISGCTVAWGEQTTKPQISVRSKMVEQAEGDGEQYEIYFHCGGTVGSEMWWCAPNVVNGDSAQVSFSTHSLEQTREVCDVIYPTLEDNSLRCNVYVKRLLTPQEK